MSHTPPIHRHANRGVFYEGSSAERRVSACTGKERYSTFALADQVARRYRRGKRVRYQVYHCGFCGGYHLGGVIHGKRRTIAK